MAFSFVKMKSKKPNRKDPEFAELVAVRIRKLRNEHKYSQEYVIDKTGLDIHRFESAISMPTLYSLLIICKFYRITLDEFFAPMNYPSKE